MNLQRQVVAGLKWGAAAKLVTQMVAWAVTLLVIRLLVPADYGLMAMSAVVTSIFAGVAELGLGASLVQAKNLTHSDMARVSGALLILNGVCALVVCALAPLIADAVDHPRLELILQVSSVQFLLSAIAAVPQALAYREMRFKWLAATDIFSGLATSLLTLALALAGTGVWALVISNLAGYVVRTILLAAGGVFVRPAFSLQGIGAFVKFGGAWSGARFAWQLTYQVDVLIASRYLTQEAVGIYSVAVQLANMPLQKVMGLVNQVAFPTLAKLQEDMPRMRRNLLDAIRLLVIGAVPVLWGVSAVTSEFVDVLLGERWRPVILPLQLIALVAPLRMLATLFATAVSAMGRADVEFVNTLVSLAVFLGSFIVGVRWGVSGLAVAYVVAVVLSFLLTFSRTARVVGLSLREVGAVCLTCVIAGTMMVGAVHGARLGLDNAAEWLRLPLLIAVGGAVYLGVLFAIDRSVWYDARRVAAALRGSA